MSLKKQFKGENKIKEILSDHDKLYGFKRISEINKKRKKLGQKEFKIFEDTINCNNTYQGYLGTCYLLQAISVFTNYGQLLYQLFPCEDINESDIIKYFYIMKENGKKFSSMIILFLKRIQILLLFTGRLMEFYFLVFWKKPMLKFLEVMLMFVEGI